jgi:hypothetical protein
LGRCRWASRRIKRLASLPIKHFIHPLPPRSYRRRNVAKSLSLREVVRPTFAARSTCHRLISKRLSRIVHNVNLSWPQNISLRPVSSDGGVKTGELAEL